MKHVVRIHLKTDGKGMESRKKLIDFCLNGDKQYLAIGWSYVYLDNDTLRKSNEY